MCCRDALFGCTVNGCKVPIICQACKTAYEVHEDHSVISEEHKHHDGPCKFHDIRVDVCDDCCNPAAYECTVQNCIVNRICNDCAVKHKKRKTTMSHDLLPLHDK